nr:hypothetical protein Iba_chr08eCG6980 [Ipomoea batatas]
MGIAGQLRFGVLCGCQNPMIESPSPLGSLIDLMVANLLNQNTVDWDLYELHPKLKVFVWRAVRGVLPTYVNICK